MAVSETMRQIAKNSYGFETVSRNQHTVTKHRSEEKTPDTINSKLFTKLNHVNNAIYEVVLAKAQIEHKEPIFVKFSSLNTQTLVCWNSATSFPLSFEM